MTNYASQLIPDESVADALNVYFDEEDLGISRRRGYAKFNTTALTDAKKVRYLTEFVAPTNTRYIVAMSSKSMFYAITDGNFTQIPGLTNLSLDVDPDCVGVLGRLWCTNSVDTVFSWNGSSTDTITAAPKGDKIEPFRNRVAIAGKSGELSSVFLSGELVGIDWTLGTQSTSPVQIKIGGTDNKPVKCLYGGFRDLLVAWTEDETYGLYGFGTNDFQVRLISREVGCIDDRSVQEKNGSLYWLSRRGIERWRGTSIEKISDNVKNILDVIIENSQNARFLTDTSQADWDAGNLQASGSGAPLSSTISPGNVVPSTSSRTDTNRLDFDAGTFDLAKLSSDQTYGSLELAAIGDNDLFDAFTDTDFTSNPAWTVSGTDKWDASTSELEYTTPFAFGVQDFEGTLYASTATLWYGDWSVSMRVTEDAGGNRTSNARLLFISDNSNPDFANGYALMLSAADGTPAGCLLLRYDAGTPTIIGSDDTVDKTIAMSVGRSTDGIFSVGSSGATFGCSITATDTTYNASSFVNLRARLRQTVFDPCPDASCSGPIESAFDDIKIAGHYAPNGAFTSSIFDTLFSTPTPAPIVVSSTTPNGTTLTYRVRSATSPSGDFNAFTVVTDQDVPTNLNRRYWQYSSSFTTTISTVTPRLDQMNLRAATTAYFIDRCFSVGSNITSWGLFQANTLETSGSITHFVNSGTSCNQVTRPTATWTSQTNNAPITVATNTFIGVRNFFDFTSATSVITVPLALQDVTVNWNDGSNRPRVATVVYKDRYEMSYTSSNVSGQQNDMILTIDSKDAFSKHDAPDCYSSSLFNRRWYCGDSSDTGFIYQLDIGEDDNGLGYRSFIKTKDYAFGDIDREKQYNRAYLHLSPEPDSSYNISLDLDYRIDASSETLSLGTVNLGDDSTGGILTSKFPFPVDQNQSSRYINFMLSNNGANQPWRLFNMSFYFRYLNLR